MEITLEQIELVKDRTGVSYKEAKEALEFSGGNVVDAIIYIEDHIDASGEKKDSSKIDSFKEFVKETVKKGNVNKIKVYKDDELVLNLPLSAGIIGVILFRWWGLIAAVFATGVTKCKVELVKEDGSVIDITDKACEAFDTVKDKGGVIVDEVADKSADIYEAAKAKGADLCEHAREKGSDIYDVVKDKATELINRISENDAEGEAGAKEGAQADAAEGAEAGAEECAQADAAEGAEAGAEECAQADTAENADENAVADTQAVTEDNAEADASEIKTDIKLGPDVSEGEEEKEE